MKKQVMSPIRQKEILPQNQKTILPSIFLKQESQLTTMKNLILLSQELVGFKNTNYIDISICFLVDVTGSMMPYVSFVRSSIETIQQTVRQNMNMNEQKLRVSMVGYRDRKDQKPVETFNFTTIMDEFKQFANTIEFTGGDDECEDVVAGLNEVVSLDWSKNDLNLVIWIADAPCHGKKYHSDLINDDFPEDGDQVEKLLKQFAEKNIELFFYKINDSTDQMIELFQEYSFVFNKFIKNQAFDSNNFTQSLVNNVQHSNSKQGFSQFFSYVEKFEKTQQLEHCQRLKKINKNFIKLQMSQVSISQQSASSYAKRDSDVIQELDIENINDLNMQRKEFTTFKLQMSSNNINRLEICETQQKKMKISKYSISQGAFKECYLAQDCSRGTHYAMKRFKENTPLDFDNIVIEYYIHLLAQNIRDSFVEDLEKQSTMKSNHQEFDIFFDELYIAYDKVENQFYLMETFKYGFMKFFNNDSSAIQCQSETQSKIYQCFMHYSFRYSNYNFILSDIQGFNNVLNDISIHVQSLINNFQNTPKSKSQILQSFLNGEKIIDLEKIKTNTHINSNLGDLGIILFFKRHECNQFCELLSLKNLKQLHEIDLNGQQQIQEHKQERGRRKDQSIGSRVRTTSTTSSASARLAQIEQICQQ